MLGILCIIVDTPTLLDLLSDESYTLDHGGMGSPFSAIADVHTD